MKESSEGRGSRPEVSNSWIREELGSTESVQCGGIDHITPPCLNGGGSDCAVLGVLEAEEDEYR